MMLLLFTPLLFSSPNLFGATPIESSTTPIVNHLVKADLVLSDLANILSVTDPETQPKSANRVGSLKKKEH